MCVFLSVLGRYSRGHGYKASVSSDIAVYFPAFAGRPTHFVYPRGMARLI